MKSKFILIMVGTVLMLLFSCGTHKVANIELRNVEFEVARNYYFSGDAIVPANPIVATREQFERLYGAAAVMGKDGAPTAIDFEHQFVIGIVLPLTNDETEVVPTHLTTDGKTLVLYYKVNIGARNMSSTMRPMALVVVDKRFLAGECLLQREK
jgi:hypothetical protein